MYSGLGGFWGIGKYEAHTYTNLGKWCFMHSQVGISKIWHLHQIWNSKFSTFTVSGVIFACRYVVRGTV